MNIYVISLLCTNREINHKNENYESENEKNNLSGHEPIY